MNVGRILSGNVFQRNPQYLRDISHVEEVVDLCRSGQHASGDEVVDLDGGLSHEVSQWLHVFVEILQLLVDHSAKYPSDLALLNTNKRRQSFKHN